MSIVSLKKEEKGGVSVAWVDYSSRLILAICDYQDRRVQLTSDQVEFILEFLKRYPPQEEEAAMKAFYEAEDRAAEAELAARGRWDEKSDE